MSSRPGEPGDGCRLGPDFASVGCPAHRLHRGQSGDWEGDGGFGQGEGRQGTTGWPWSWGTSPNKLSRGARIPWGLSCCPKVPLSGGLSVLPSSALLQTIVTTLTQQPDRKRDNLAGGGAPEG